MAKKNKAKKDILAGLSSAEKEKVTSLAMKMRKAALRKNREKNRKNKRNQQDEYEARRGKVDDSLEHWLEKAMSKLGETSILEQETRDLKQGTVVQLSRGGGVLLYEDEYIPFDIKTELMMVQKTAMSIGEYVLFSQDDDQDTGRYNISVLL